MLCDAVLQVRLPMKQWMLRITAYADRCVLGWLTLCSRLGQTLALCSVFPLD